MADWGSAGAGSFTKRTFSDVHPAIDPTFTNLPDDFIVCVIGASRGIGAGIATSYARAGAAGIILSGRRISGLQQVAEECKSLAMNTKFRVEIVPCDLSKSSDVETLAVETKRLFGGLDVLALNSGISGNVHLKAHECPADEFAHTASINYIGTFLCAKYFVPLLFAKLDGAKTFAIVSSFASLIVRGPIANVQYCVSKMAQLKLAEHLHEEYNEQGLKVFCVHPGAVASEQALETSPEVFKPYLTDSPELCGAFMVWLNQGGGERAWLSGRLLDAKWDVEELESRKDEIVAKELLKTRLRLS